MDEKSLRALLDELPDEKEEITTDEWRNAAYDAQHRVEVLEFKLKKAKDNIELLINFIPDGWQMPLGWSLLVSQIKGEL